MWSQAVGRRKSTPPGRQVRVAVCPQRSHMVSGARTRECLQLAFGGLREWSPAFPFSSSRQALQLHGFRHGRHMPNGMSSPCPARGNVYVVCRQRWRYGMARRRASLNQREMARTDEAGRVAWGRCRRAAPVAGSGQQCRSQLWCVVPRATTMALSIRGEPTRPREMDRASRTMEIPRHVKRLVGVRRHAMGVMPRYAAERAPPAPAKVRLQQCEEGCGRCQVEKRSVLAGTAIEPQAQW